MIDKHSPTWQAIESLLKKERESAVHALISNKDSDKQRGRIELIDKVLKQADPIKSNPITSTQY